MSAVKRPPMGFKFDDEEPAAPAATARTKEEARRISESLATEAGLKPEKKPAKQGRGVFSGRMSQAHLDALALMTDEVGRSAEIYEEAMRDLAAKAVKSGELLGRPMRSQTHEALKALLKSL